MNIRFVMPTSLSSLRIALFLLVVISNTACESKQEDAPKPLSPAATASAEPGILELPEGSTTFAHLQTDRVRSGRSSRPKRERFWPTRIDWHI